MSIGLLQRLAPLVGGVDSLSSGGVAGLLAQCSFGRGRGERGDQAVGPTQEVTWDAAVAFFERDAGSEVFFRSESAGGTFNVQRDRLDVFHVLVAVLCG